MKLLYRRTEAEVRAVPVPEKTNTYVPVPNALVIDSIRDRINKEGYKYMGAGFRLSNADQVAAGMIAVAPKQFDASLGIVQNISWLNSYNRERRLSLGSGALVLACTNGMFIERLFSGADRFHRGKVLEQIEAMLDVIFTSIDERFQAIAEQVAILQKTMVSVEFMQRLTGKLFLDAMFNAHRLHAFRNNLTNDKNFAMVSAKDMTAWNAYNQVTEILKNSTPGTLVSNHVDAHDLVMNLLLELDMLTEDQVIRPVGMVVAEDEPEATDVDYEEVTEDAQIPADIAEAIKEPFEAEKEIF